MTLEASKRELTGNESLEELEAWLELQTDEDVDEQNLDDNAEPINEEVTKVEETEIVDNNAAESAPVDSENNDSAEQVLLAKDGVNTIPFNVLETERTKNQTLQQRIEELESTQAESEKNARIIELRNNQLSKLGVEPADLPEDITISDEEWEQYAEDYPELARPLRALAAKVQVMEKSSAPATNTNQSHEPVHVDVNEIIRSIPELDQMRNENGADWQSAMQIDDQLKSNPMWQSRSMNERFAEVTRQVAVNKQQAITQRAAVATQQAIDNATNQLPSSPSEIGTTASHQVSNEEFMKTASAAEMEAKFMLMEQHEIDALLEL